MAKQKGEKREYFKREFDALAINGCIGDPNGQSAYAYIRVSSDEQAEEGRSGLPRQIKHCHEIAAERGYRIPWEMVFADDYTGFEFEDRPELTKLRREYRNGKRAGAVVMEYLDRLSRNADWHQGFLLEEMKKHGFRAVFWQAFNSRVERAVMGAVSQDAMELAKKRMKDGTTDKAKSGRITAKRRCYGYHFVDSQGRAGETARKDTHYAPYEPEVPAICYIYEQVAIRGVPLRRLAVLLDGLYAPPLGSHWIVSTIQDIIKNPVYKGEFVAERYQRVKQLRPTRDGLGTRTVSTCIERPKEDWIVVPVPPIVSAELWDMANARLAKNRATSRRNAKEPYLLTGLVKCATCGRTYDGQNAHCRPGYNRRLYRCGSRCRSRAERAVIGCAQGTIGCRILDDAVWAVVSAVMEDPDMLIGALDKRFTNETNADLLRQIEHLQGTIEGKTFEDEKNRKVYLAGGYDEYEFAAMRQQLKAETRALQAEIAKIQSRVLTADQVEEKKRSLLAQTEQIKQAGDLKDAPFEVKQRIIKLMVDRIELNVADHAFTLDGVIRGAYSLGNIASTSIH